MDLLEILNAIPCAMTTYEEWVKIGMALKKEGCAVSVWEDWSRNDSRYHEGECAKKWNGFDRTNDTEVTGGTLVEIAKQYGYIPPSKDMTPLDWDAVISSDWEPDAIVSDKAWLDTEARENQVGEPSTRWDSSGSPEELKQYIELLFRADDKIGIVYQSFKDEDGKYKPANHGVTMTAAEMLKNIDTAISARDITLAIYSYDKKGGAWIRPNPLDGEGYGNKNVLAYRYALVESDKMPVNQQIAIIREMNLPVKALVYSGAKSVHAIVRIDAANEKEYRQRVDRLYTECERNHFEIDTQNKNASRLSRMPGVWRNGQKQFIIDANFGASSWQAWIDWLEDAQDPLPEVEDMADVLANPPELTPVLIDGVLRKGHKMLIAGPPKAGKSFLLMELAVDITEGQKWLGFNCTQGKVLYINLEVDRASAINRLSNIYKAKGLTPSHNHDLYMWNLRGKSVPLNILAPRIVRRCRDLNLSAIILDPIYKVLTGDENSASDMAAFCNQFDKIAAELECSIIYVHHHSKGGQAGKRSMDRASGSGVFSRDPDALLDMIELNAGDDEEVTAWRIESTLREFKPAAPINIWFKYPIHSVDTSGKLKHKTPKDPADAMIDRQKEQKEDSKQQAVDAYEDLVDWNGSSSDGWVSIKDIATQVGRNPKTVKGYFNEMDEFEYRSSSGGNTSSGTNLNGSWVRRKPEQ